MGKIFGISDLPVSTIESALQPLTVPPPTVKYLGKEAMESSDKFVSKTSKPTSNAIIKMRNGFGKLMSHFSKAKPQKTKSL